ncbi:MAG: hypothetical protein K2X74_08270 [Acetobacteraceae bacterium]|nr:hypothetical protein [Acetobacteraceae bacterium]
MPSTPQDLAESTFEFVRKTYYKDRTNYNKSDNKWYDPGKVSAALASWVAARNAVRDVAHEQINALRQEVEKQQIDEKIGLSKAAEGDFMIKQMNAHREFRAFNCQELTALCAAIAKHRLGAEDAQLYWAAVDPPGDHAFALFGTLDGMKAAHRAVIQDFKRLKFGDEPMPWVADVWLNTCCSLADYPARVSTKLGEWEQEGKRLWWTGRDDNQPGWYNPSGEYKFSFLRSTVKIRKAA